MQRNPMKHLAKPAISSPQNKKRFTQGYGTAFTVGKTDVDMT